MKKTPEKKWTFATQVPWTVKERLDSLSRADYKKLIDHIREELAAAGKAAAEKNGDDSDDK